MPDQDSEEWDYFYGAEMCFTAGALAHPGSFIPHPTLHYPSHYSPSIAVLSVAGRAVCSLESCLRRGTATGASDAVVRYLGHAMSSTTLSGHAFAMCDPDVLTSIARLSAFTAELIVNMVGHWFKPFWEDQASPLGAYA